jgi:endonuclease YncB( thermonuclease family)
MMERNKQTLPVACGLALAFLAPPAQAADKVEGPVAAAVTRVLDGDTLEVRAEVWLGIELTSHVRIRGIDAPELHSSCAAERTMAEAARDRLTTLVGDSVRLSRIEQDKYGGRVDADVVNAAGTDLKAAMLAAGLARPYDGGTRGDWCQVGSIEPLPK